MQKFDIFKFYGKNYTKLGFSGKNNAKVAIFYNLLQNSCKN